MYNKFILILFLEGVIMNEKRVDNIEKRVAALEKIIKEQQNKDDEFIIKKLVHPS